MNTILNYVPTEAKLNSIKSTKTAPKQSMNNQEISAFQLAANQAVDNSMATAANQQAQIPPMTNTDGFGRTA